MNPNEQEADEVDDEPRAGSGRLHYGAGRHQPTAVRRRLAFAGVALVVVCLIGTFGYYRMGQGRWAYEDCAYMVLITLTTVGYEEVLPIAQEPGGRAFTMVLLVGGMGVSFYFLSSLTAFIIEGDLREVLWRRRMQKRLDSLKNHYIVCGAGRTGRYVTLELLRAGCEVVVIEREKRHFDSLHEEHGDKIYAIEGDATEDTVLKAAGLERAKGLVTSLQLDQDNLFVSMSARQMNPAIRIVSRANTERAAPKLKQAGADVVISPTNIGGRRMAHEMLRPNVVGFLDITHDVHRNLDIEEVLVPVNSPVVGKTLAHSRIREKSDALVLAVVHEGKATYNPRPGYELGAGMTLIVLGEREQLVRLHDYIAGGR